MYSHPLRCSSMQAECETINERLAQKWISYLLINRLSNVFAQRSSTVNCYRDQTTQCTVHNQLAHRTRTCAFNKWISEYSCCSISVWANDAEMKIESETRAIARETFINRNLLAATAFISSCSMAHRTQNGERGEHETWDMNMIN